MQCAQAITIETLSVFSKLMFGKKKSEKDLSFAKKETRGQNTAKYVTRSRQGQGGTQIYTTK